MRKQYETEQDRTNERSIIDQGLKVWGNGTQARKLPSSYILDWAILDEDDNIVCWVETKKWTNVYEDFETYMVSLHKILAMQNMTTVTGLPSILMVGWSDQTRVWSPSNGKVTLKWGGRYVQKRDSQDVEPVVHIPIADFKRLDE